MVRPRLSHTARTTAARACASSSGIAATRLASAMRDRRSHGPTVRPTHPPRFDACTGPNVRIPAANARSAPAWMRSEVGTAAMSLDYQTPPEMSPCSAHDLAMA